MFYRDSHQVYHARPLDDFGWLAHGFGTRLSGDPGLDGSLATLHQVHSSICVNAGGRTGRLGDGDALLENKPGRRVGVKTADCLPVLLVDEHTRAVAAVHAGWRGTAQGIAQRAVEAMGREFSSRPGDLHAAIGPGIGPCCYEVGPEVAAQFGIRSEGPARVDLTRANIRQLEEAGIAPSRIYAANLCTRCLAGEFHSYRRDREQAGRMISFAGVR